MLNNTSEDQGWTLRTAEFVLPGHPDKLADALADALVAAARARDPRALVGVEVAVHRDRVFIDGRIAGAGAAEIDVRGLARQVYASAGYGRDFGPHPRRLRIVTDLCLEPLQEGEAEIRALADDQAIITGYACATPGTHHLPVEHALAQRLARLLAWLRVIAPQLRLGPDGKVIVFVAESPDGRAARLVDLSVSLQHAADWDPVLARREITAELATELEAFTAAVPGFEVPDPLPLVINGAGDFVVGGPYGDNGLSGKKLVADFYGPRVPIGGGALSGKDFHKVDRAGPLIARALALQLVTERDLRDCTVTLGIRPGDRAFHVLRAETGGRSVAPPAELEALVDLRLDSQVAWPDTAGDLVQRARWGHFVPPAAVPPVMMRSRRTAVRIADTSYSERCEGHLDAWTEDLRVVHILRRSPGGQLYLEAREWLTKPACEDYPENTERMDWIVQEDIRRASELERALRHESGLATPPPIEVDGSEGVAAALAAFPEILDDRHERRR